jgi:hypothetical protein
LNILRPRSPAKRQQIVDYRVQFVEDVLGDQFGPYFGVLLGWQPTFLSGYQFGPAIAIELSISPSALLIGSQEIHAAAMHPIPDKPGVTGQLTKFSRHHFHFAKLI